MRQKRGFRFQLGLLVVAMTVGAISTGGQAPNDDLHNNIVGTWQLVSGKYGDTDLSATSLANATTLKHITPSQWTWLSYKPDTGVVFRSAGGPYTLKGNVYTESPQYGFSSDFETVKGKQHTFTVRVEASKLYQSGALSDGLKIEEVYERVK